MGEVEGDEASTTRGLYLGRPWGTDATAGPFDALFNKGYAVAQWEDRNRRIFDHAYGWREVGASITNPGAAAARVGGWGEVLKVHALPFYYGGYRDPQWVTNWFGHVVEGGMVYRRLAEWNEHRGVPLPRLTAAAVTWASAVVNEAYETPPAPPGEPALGNAGIFMDLMVFDPLGIWLWSLDPVVEFGERLGMALWPAQGSWVVNRSSLQNNGESIVFKLPLPWTRHGLMLRGGVGAEGGLTWSRLDGIDVSISVGMQSYDRTLDPDTGLESAKFSPSSGIWIDREDVLLASLTFDARTDRRVGLNVYPGVLDTGSLRLGGWLMIDADGRPLIGVTGRSAGLGVGWGF